MFVIAKKQHKKWFKYMSKPWNKDNTDNSPLNNHDVEGICETAAESIDELLQDEWRP